MAESREYLKITEHKDFTEVEFLKPCGLRWSTDGTTWYGLLNEVPAGTRYVNFDAPEDARRNYAAIVDGQPAATYYHRVFAEGFAAVMSDIFSADGVSITR